MKSRNLNPYSYRMRREFNSGTKGFFVRLVSGSNPLQSSDYPEWCFGLSCTQMASRCAYKQLFISNNVK